MKKPPLLTTVLLLALLLCGGVLAQGRQGEAVRKSKLSLREVNQVARPDANHVVAILGATLIDGRGGPPVPDAAIVVRGERIIAVGKRAAVNIPSGAEVINAGGLTLGASP